MVLLPADLAIGPMGIPISPIRTRVEDYEEYRRYSEIFTFEAQMDCPTCIAHLQITYERAVHGKYHLLPEDNLIISLLPNIQMAHHVVPFTEKRESWMTRIMEHAETEAEKSKFLADSVNAVVLRMLPLLVVNGVHM